TGDEINGAFLLFQKPEQVTVIGGEERVALFSKALARHGVKAAVKEPEEALTAGLARILEQRRI
ncbi:MAG TPA: hypothetical protein VKA80_03355, partial [Beijerinckiaceae bacterium]|nr:hypothetical protein [Beijerinckiaceae bacterium]